MAADPKAQLQTLLEAIFADGVVEVKERQALAAFRSEGKLDADQIEKGFRRFVENKWGEAAADGVVTAQEELLLKTIVDELGVPEDKLPLQLKMALRD